MTTAATECVIGWIIVWNQAKLSSIGIFHGEPRMHDLLVALQVREGLKCFETCLASLRLAALVFSVVLKVTLVDKRSTAFAVDTILQSLFASNAMNGCRYKMTTPVFYFTAHCCRHFRMRNRIAYGVTNRHGTEKHTQDIYSKEKGEIRRLSLDLVRFSFWGIVLERKCDYVQVGPFKANVQIN